MVWSDDEIDGVELNWMLGLVDVEMDLVPLRVDENNVGFYAIYHDITELQRAREEAEAVLGKHFVEKPLLGREGQNVRIVSEQGTFERAGDYTDNGFIYQKV